jgi:DNA-binding beta-propeller fold protein YncE
MDRGNNRVVHLAATGQFLDAFGRLGRGPEDIFSGWDVALDKAGNIYISNHIFDADASYRSHDGLKVFRADGTFLQEIGGQDYRYEDSFHYTPYGLDIDSQGRIYVADFDANTVRVFETNGQVIATLFGQHGSEPGQFNGLSYVAVDSQRNLLYASDEANSRVQQFDLSVTGTGQLTPTHRLSIGAYGQEPGQFAYPQDIAVDENSGRVYVADMGNRRIQVFDSDGQYLAEFSQPGEWQVIGLDIGPDGAIYATDARNNLILVFEPDGRLRRQIEITL